MEKPWIINGGLTLRQANLLYVESCARSRAYMVISTIFKLSWYTVKLTIKAQHGEKEILWCPTNNEASKLLEYLAGTELRILSLSNEPTLIQPGEKSLISRLIS